jgi:hypothetical protein
VEFEWDPARNAANIANHGIDFADVAAIFKGDFVHWSDVRRMYGEIRMVAVGELNGEEITVVCTDRAENCRIISARRANRRERAIFRAVYPGQSTEG